MATVLDAQWGIAPEVTYGTQVTPTTVNGRFYEVKPGDGIDYRPNRVQDDGLRPGMVGPRAKRRTTPNGDYGASFNHLLLSRGFGLLLNLMCGTSVSTLVSGSTYQVNHTLGGALKPFTGQLGVPRIQADGSAAIDPFTLVGCVIPSFGISLDNASNLMLKYDVDARDFNTTTPLATYGAPSGTQTPFTFKGASLYGGTYTAPGTNTLPSAATPLANVTNFNLDVSRNADVGRYLAGQGGKKAIPIPGVAAGTGTVGIEYSDTTYRDGFLNDTDLTLVAKFETDVTLSAGVETFTVAIANIRLDGELPKPTGETTKASPPFTALENDTNPLLQFVQRTADSTL